MIEEQPTIAVATDTLVAKARELLDQGYRLVQIGATSLPPGAEVNYSFDKDYHFLNLRLTLPAPTAEIPSISGVYWSAFLYENEMHDLFGFQIKGMAMHYKGNFYQMSRKFPFVDKVTAAETAAAPAADKEKGT